MLNKIFTICSSVTLIIAFIATGYADEHFPFLAQVIKESVNVRAGPNTNFEKIDKLNKGTQVVVVGRSYEWYKVQPLSTTNSYIRSDYLKIGQGQVATVSGDNVNVRCRASSNAASLGEIKRGTLVKVLEQADGWSRLSPVAGTIAWINQDFLQEVSADVPGSMLIPAVPSMSPVITQAPVALPKAPVAVSPWVSMRGTVEVLVQPLDSDVHYEMVLDDKSVFLLQDIPQISTFTNTVVNIEGALVADPQKKFRYPLLHISKIALVL